MNRSKLSALAGMITGVFCLALLGNVFAQSGAEAASETPGLESEQSGLASGSEAGTSRESSKTGSSEPDLEQSGGASSRTGESGTSQTSRAGEGQASERSRGGHGMAQVPAGIGEQGTGQTQSSLER